MSSARTLARRIRGSAFVARAAYGQRKIPYLPWPEIEARRDRRVSETARYAAATVPHYRELFETAGIEPSTLARAADLERLPVLEKETVRRDPDRFVSESPAGQSSVPFLTSGTTGLRLRIHHDRRSLLLNTAYRERQRHVEVRLCGKELRSLKVTIDRPGGTGNKVRKLLDESTVLLRQRTVTLSSADPIELIVRRIDELRPDILRSAGSTIELLFRTVAASGARMHLPRVAVYGDDMMTSEARELIQRDFGVPVVSHYNAVEAFHIGFTCEASGPFHLYHDLTHVAVLPDGAEQPEREGRGAVVISNLVNRGTVLLNYRLGDVATLSWAQCPCGRSGPVLTDLEGRVEDFIWLVDGTRVSPRLVWDAIRKHESVIRYQLVQVEPARFELGLVTDSPDDYACTVGGIVAELRQLLHGARIAPRFDATLARPMDRKFRPVVALPRPG